MFGSRSVIWIQFSELFPERELCKFKFNRNGIWGRFKMYDHEEWYPWNMYLAQLINASCQINPTY